MQTILRKQITCLVLLLFPVFIHSQSNDAELLNKGSKISKKITTGETHEYHLNLETDKYVYIKLFQKGIDLKINLFVDDEELGEFDSPNYRNGEEPITFTTTKKGKYRLKVSSIDDEDHNGMYDISVLKIDPKATTIEGQVDQLFTVYDTNKTPGAAISVIKDGKIIYKKGYGMSNLEYGIPIAPSTVFHIASVSKQFTAFAILLLEKDGKLSYDDDVRKYIPEVPDFGKTITLRHLANHTSGMRDQWNLLAIGGWRLDDVITKEHVMKLVERQEELNFNPGEEYLYCNTGFTLMAEVVARVSGKTFAEFTEERIFKPLGMNSTLFYDDHEKIVKNRAYSYYGASDGYKKSILSYANVGATSLFTTVEDLSQWALNFENPKVGTPEMMEEMKQKGVLNNGNEINYALGQSVGKYKGLNRVGHGGADAGYRTYIGRFPDQKFSVITFGNDAGFNSGGLAHQIADLYLKDDFQEEDKPQRKEKETADNDEGNIVVDQEILQSYVGEYEIQPGFILSITTEGDKLFGQATGQSQVELAPKSDKEFLVTSVNAKITFNTENSGQISSLTLLQGGQNIEAKRLKSFDKDGVDLEVYTGKFYSSELETSYQLIVEEGQLLARHSRLEDIKLTPTKEDFFSGNQWFFGQIEFTRNDNDQINGCKVTSGRVRNLKFIKVD